MSTADETKMRAGSGAICVDFREPAGPQMSVYKVTKQGQMFAYRVTKSRKCSPIGLHFFEGLTIELNISLGRGC